MPDANQLNLTDADRLMLKSAMDLIVPPVDDLPGAGELGLVDNAVELANREKDFGDALLKALSALHLDPSARAEGGFAALDDEQRVAALKFLEASLPAVFDKLVDLVYVVYYSDERVHQRIGWRSGALQPFGWELPSFDPAILETVSKREPFWRKA
ncbi:MAG: gluconate 2-dehydrogenase subunit 3 family protein [Chloroflexi bacterium]|nr:gluconate 2-dehydrogenase subunit 3 family protein [Chloroflexota bacterium]